MAWPKFAAPPTMLPAALPIPVPILSSNGPSSIPCGTATPCSPGLGGSAENTPPLIVPMPVAGFGVANVGIGVTLIPEPTAGAVGAAFDTGSLIGLDVPSNNSPNDSAIILSMVLMSSNADFLGRPRPRFSVLTFSVSSVSPDLGLYLRVYTVPVLISFLSNLPVPFSLAFLLTSLIISSKPSAMPCSGASAVFISVMFTLILPCDVFTITEFPSTRSTIPCSVFHPGPISLLSSPSAMPCLTVD